MAARGYQGGLQTLEARKMFSFFLPPSSSSFPLRPPSFLLNLVKKEDALTHEKEHMRKRDRKIYWMNLRLSENDCSSCNTRSTLAPPLAFFLLALMHSLLIIILILLLL